MVGVRLTSDRQSGGMSVAITTLEQAMHLDDFHFGYHLTGEVFGILFLLVTDDYQTGIADNDVVISTFQDGDWSSPIADQPPFAAFNTLPLVVHPHDRITASMVVKGLSHAIGKVPSLELVCGVSDGVGSVMSHEDNDGSQLGCFVNVTVGTLRATEDSVDGMSDVELVFAFGIGTIHLVDP